MKISLCMVVRDEEKNLPGVFRWAKGVVDEIVIMDQGSTDGTPAICRDWGVYYHRTTRKDLADVDRQDCYNLATGDYCLALDADELPDVRLTRYLKSLKNKDLEALYHVYWFPFLNLVDGVDIKPILGDDWHPRFWRIGDNILPPVIVWPATAHTFPQINTAKVLFCNRGKIVHKRTLARIKRVHEERMKVIDPSNQQLEQNFLETLERFLNVRKLGTKGKRG